MSHVQAAPYVGRLAQVDARPMEIYMSKFTVEYTDTFGGEANYSWVKRAEFDNATGTNLAIIRKAKALMGLSGVRGRTEDCGDMLKFTPYKSNTVLFVTYTEGMN